MIHKSCHVPGIMLGPEEERLEAHISIPEVPACRKFILYWERSYHSDEDKI